MSEPVQRVKYYQKGTLTVGNRLINPASRTVQASMNRTNAITSGHRACQGCGEALGARYAARTGIVPEIHICHASDGAHQLK